MDRIFDAAGEVLDASDLYASLMDPANTGAEIPERLLDRTRPSATSRRTGWALDLTQSQPILPLSSNNQIACNNASFTASTPGGFLPQLFTRLDTGPNFNPGLWTQYPFGPHSRYRYLAYAYSLLWRGKVCGRAGYHPDVCIGLGCSPDSRR